MTRQLNMFTAIGLRDEGMARVLENAGTWTRQAKAVYRLLDWEGAKTAEQIRHMIEVRIGSPHDPHIWGSLANWALDQNLIEKVGWARMQDLKSHGRETPTYRRVK